MCTSCTSVLEVWKFRSARLRDTRIDASCPTEGCRSWMSALDRSPSTSICTSSKGAVCMRKLKSSIIIYDTISVFCQGIFKNFTLISSITWSVVKLGADWVFRFVLCMGRETNQKFISDTTDGSVSKPLLHRWRYIQTNTEKQ